MQSAFCGVVDRGADLVPSAGQCIVGLRHSENSAPLAAVVLEKAIPLAAKVLSNGRRAGLELEFVDQGPGIADLNRALAGGFSTAKSLGLGLSGTRRLVDEFNIDTAPGRGTKVVIRKWKKEF